MYEPSQLLILFSLPLDVVQCIKWPTKTHGLTLDIWMHCPECHTCLCATFILPNHFVSLKLSNKFQQLRTVAAAALLCVYICVCVCVCVYVCVCVCSCALSASVSAGSFPTFGPSPQPTPSPPTSILPPSAPLPPQTGEVHTAVTTIWEAASFTTFLSYLFCPASFFWLNARVTLPDWLLLQVQQYNRN